MKRVRCSSTSGGASATVERVVQPAKKGVHVSFTTIDMDFEQADSTELAEKQCGQRHNAEIGFGSELTKGEDWKTFWRLVGSLRE